MNQLLRGLLCLTCASSNALQASDDHWPRFRGPNANGVVVDDARYPMAWDTETNVAWQAPIPGWGWSSPAIWGDRVFVTTVVSDAENENPQAGLYLGRGREEIPKGEHRWLVYCLKLETGEVLWEREAHRGRAIAPRHPKNTYATETPTTDGERIYALFGDLGLYCYDFDGNPVWEHKIETKPTFYNYGAAASPVVHEDQVIYVYDNQEASYIAALDKMTGEITWKKEREESTNWATPYIWETEDRVEIVTSGKNRIRSYTLDGEEIWSLDGKMSVLTIPSPFAAEGLLYINSGYFQDSKKPAWVIRPGAEGDITPEDSDDLGPYVVWQNPRIGTYNTTPLVYQGLHYTLYDRGMISVHDAQTGEERYDRERFPRLTSFTAAPWGVNDHVFCLSETGKTFVLKSGPAFEIVATNDLEELAIATPSLANGYLLIRTATKVWAITDLSLRN